MDPFVLRAVVHRDLLARTLDQVVPDHSTLRALRSQRLAEGYADGLSRLRRLLGEEGVDEELLLACWEQAAEDPRFGFLLDLPGSAAFGAWAAAALGEAFFGSSDPESIDVAALLNTSIRLVDGLLDDVPGAFMDGGEQIRETLEHYLGGGGTGSAVENHEARLSELGEGNHPVLALALAAVRGWASRVASSSGATADPSFRDSFRNAALSALDAELNSAKLAPVGRSVEAASCASTLSKKSANALWLIALAGFAGHGWPPGVDRGALSRAFRQLGIYFEWIDDMADLLTDLDAGRWNLAHLAILETNTTWNTLDDPTLAFWICGSLADEAVSDRLVEATVRELRRAMSLLEEVAPQLEPLETLVRNATYDWLTADG